jgi:hypothetical protein
MQYALLFLFVQWFFIALAFYVAFNGYLGLSFLCILIAIGLGAMSIIVRKIDIKDFKSVLV